MFYLYAFKSRVTCWKKNLELRESKIRRKKIMIVLKKYSTWKIPHKRKNRLTSKPEKEHQKFHFFYAIWGIISKKIDFRDSELVVGYTVYKVSIGTGLLSPYLDPFFFFFFFYCTTLEMVSVINMWHEFRPNESSNSTWYKIRNDPNPPTDPSHYLFLSLSLSLSLSPYLSLSHPLT